MDVPILPAAPSAPILSIAPVLKKAEKKGFVSVSEVVKQTLKKNELKPLLKKEVAVQPL